MPKGKYPRPDRLLRFTRKLIKTSECWYWTGSLNRDGYGIFWFDCKRIGAHRAAYLMFKGPIEDGLEIDHLCRVRSCVNPDHLEAVSKRENILRGVGLAAQNAKKTSCPQGHSYTDSNISIRSGRSARYCKQCHAEQYSKYSDERREQIKSKARSRYRENKL